MTPPPRVLLERRDRVREPSWIGHTQAAPSIAGIVALAEAVRRLAIEAQRCEGLSTGAISTLFHLGDPHNQPIAKHAAAALAMSKPAVTQALAELEQRGLIARRARTGGSISWEVSAAGMITIGRLDQWAEPLAKAVDALDATLQRKLGRASQELVDCLSGTPGAVMALPAGATEDQSLASGADRRAARPLAEDLQL